MPVTQSSLYSCIPLCNTQTIDSHSEKPCFSVEFVDTYSIHSFPPPSRRTQQIQGFQRVVLVCVLYRAASAIARICSQEAPIKILACPASRFGLSATIAITLSGLSTFTIGDPLYPPITGPDI